MRINGSAEEIGDEDVSLGGFNEEITGSRSRMDGNRSFCLGVWTPAAYRLGRKVSEMRAIDVDEVSRLVAEGGKLVEVLPREEFRKSTCRTR